MGGLVPLIHTLWALLVVWHRGRPNLFNIINFFANIFLNAIRRGCFCGIHNLFKPVEIHVMGLLTAEHKRCVGKVSSPLKVDINRSDIIKYSIATEQLQEKYLKGNEAPLMFIFNLFTPLVPLATLGKDGLNRKETFNVNFPLKRVMAGGTKINLFKNIYPGDKLTGISKIKDLYEKKGKSGPLIFMINQFSVSNQFNLKVYDETQTTIFR